MARTAWRIIPSSNRQETTEEVLRSINTQYHNAFADPRENKKKHYLCRHDRNQNNNSIQNTLMK